MRVYLAIMSLLQVHDFGSLPEFTFSGVLNLIQPNISCEGRCAKEPTRPSESKVMILEAYKRIVYLVAQLGNWYGVDMKLSLL